MFSDHLVECWNRSESVVRIHVRDEPGPDRCAVFVCDVRIRCDITHIALLRCDQRESRSEQEKLDFFICVKSDYLGQDRERRIVHDDVVLLILHPFIVAARIERTHELVLLHFELIRYPVAYCLEDVVRCVAVVRCFLQLELLQEVIVLVIVFLSVRVVALVIREPVGVDLSDQLLDLFTVESGESRVKV